MTKVTGASGDVLELRPDGTVRLAWDDKDITLRRPTFGEWRSYIEEAEAADAWLNAETRSLADLMGDDGPFWKLYLRIFRELGDLELDRDQLTPWMVDSVLRLRLSGHWRSDPLTRSAAVAQAPTPSR